MAHLTRSFLPCIRRANGLSRLRDRLFVTSAAVPLLCGHALRHCAFTTSPPPTLDAVQATSPGTTGPATWHAADSSTHHLSSLLFSAAPSTPAAAAPTIVSVGDAVLTPGGQPLAAPRVDTTHEDHPAAILSAATHTDPPPSPANGPLNDSADRQRDEPPHTSAAPTPTALVRSSSTALPTAEGKPYALWEIRALVLALLPPHDPRVSRGMTDKDVLYVLPKAVRQQLMSCEEGGLLGYVRRHMSPHDVVMQGRHMWRVVRRDDEAEAGVEEETTKLQPASSSASSSAPNTIPPKRAPLVTQTSVVEMLIPYLPTFYVAVQQVEAQMPDEVATLYAGTTFSFFIRRLRSYVQIRSEHGYMEVRLRPDFDHPRRGEADRRYRGALPCQPSRPDAADDVSGTGGESVSHEASPADGATQVDDDGRAAYRAMRRPAHNSEAGLIALIVPRLPNEFSPLAEVLRDITDVVSRHAAFDPRLGIRGLFEKYPEYIQIVEGKLRVRPYRCAPNAIQECDGASSPLPAVYARLVPVVERAAEGVRYEVASEKEAAMVPTGRLYAMLSAEEKATMKHSFRSFPRFLRMHGKELVVTVDNMRVYKFRPEYEPCAETLLDQRLWMNILAPDDPIRKIPAEMAESTQADWAVRELYDALPLTQSVELQEVLSLVPASVRQALPAEEAGLLAQLERFPEYFATWPYPDNSQITMVQRAKVEIPALEASEIIRVVLPLLPPGGTELSTVMRRSPLYLQRYFHRHGLVTTLQKFTDFVMISGDRIVRVRR